MLENFAFLGLSNSLLASPAITAVRAPKFVNHVMPVTNAKTAQSHQLFA